MSFNSVTLVQLLKFTSRLQDSGLFSTDCALNYTTLSKPCNSFACVRMCADDSPRDHIQLLVDYFAAYQLVWITFSSRKSRAIFSVMEKYVAPIIYPSMDLTF